MKYSDYVKLNKRQFQIGDIVYHRKVYEHREPLTIRGVLEDKLLLEGDYSGGTHAVTQRDWLPIAGVARIYNYAYKEECRKKAVTIEALAIPVDENKDNMTRTMFDLLHMVMFLTADIELNPEFTEP